MSKIVNGHVYNGWKPELPDFNDLMYSEHLLFKDRGLCGVTQYKDVDLRPNSPACWNQLSINSCVAHGCSYLFAYAGILEKTDSWTPSRLFVYYNARLLENNENSDGGAYIRDGIKCLAKYGVCPETDWAYNVAEVNVKPPTKAYQDAIKHKALTYYSVNNTSLDEIMSNLSAGFPITLGLSIYESFESDKVAKTGIIPMPSKTDKLLGGHCIAIAGAIMAKRQFILRNSWGSTGWGDKGYGYIPFDYVLNPKLATDCWTIRTTTLNT